MDKRIEITKEQFDSLYPMNEARIDKRGFSPLIVMESERRGDSYTTKDGRKLFKTEKYYVVTLPDFEIWEPKLLALLEKDAAGESTGDQFWLNVLAIVPLVELPVAEVATGNDDVQGDEGAEAPSITGTPNPLTEREASKAHTKAQRYAEMFKRSPRTKLAYDLAGAIGDQQQELALYVAIEVVEQARHFHPHDRTELAAYNELRDALAKTDAPLPDVRKFMAQAAESFGY